MKFIDFKLPTSVITPVGLTLASMLRCVWPAGRDSIRVFLDVVCSSFSCR